MDYRLVANRYKLAEKIGESGMSVVYKAYDNINFCFVIVKILKRDGSLQRWLENVLRFKKEAKAITHLEHPRIVKLYESGEEGGEQYIVTEYFEGETLSSLLKREKFLAVEEAVSIAEHVAEGLAYVHDRGVVHRDLKPGNIMLVKGTQEVKILDFGLAQFLEFTEIKDKEEIVGTFTYMSPEQSGMTKNLVDERSDLYSLGVVFYEMLTGEPPFKGEDVGELLHQQAARKPVSPRDIKSQIPQVVEEIVLKLLNKEPEERYQTAKGLLLDIRKYLQGETSFLIGKEDRLKKPTYRTRLIGREEEQKKLTEVFKETFSGHGKIVLIAGEAGLGKSRLIEDIRGYVYERQGVFVRGKCFSQENKIPYQPFKDVMNEYIHYLLEQDSEEKNNGILRIKDALGQLGGIMLNFNPHLKEVLGQESQEFVPLDLEKENSRFLMVASRFFCSLGKEQKPCVMFLDDLHWADEGSLSLLAEISGEIKNSPSLIIGTYRDNDISDKHPLHRIKKEAQEKGFALEEIPLKAFDYDRLKKFIAEILLEEQNNVADLTQYVLGKSSGNPFFTMELVRQLVDDKAIVYRETGRRWDIDWDHVNRISVPVTIVDLLLRRITALREDLLTLLSCAALIGKEFNVNLLLSCIELKKDDVADFLDEAMSLQLIERGKDKNYFVFSHDRIRDAFYKRINDAQKKALHLKIARVLEETHHKELDRVIFDLLYHYIEADDKEKILEYCLPAAWQAKDSYANEEAARYYNIAISLFEEKGEGQGAECTQAKEGLVSVYLTIGRNDESIEIARQILPLKKDALDKARVYEQMGVAYFKKGVWKDCEDNLTKALNLLGEKLPQTKLQVVLGILKEIFIRVMYLMFPRLLLHKKNKAPAVEDIEKEWCFLRLTWVYILSDLLKYVRSTLRMVNLAEMKVGKSKELAIGTGMYGTLIMSIPMSKKSIALQEKTLSLRKELKDDWGVAQSLQFFGWNYMLIGDYHKSIAYFQESLTAFQRIGDQWEEGMTAQSKGMSHLDLADFSGATECFSRYRQITEKMKDSYGTSSSMGWLGLVCIQKGELDQAEDWLLKSRELSLKKEIVFIYCFSSINSGILYIEKEDWAKAVEWLEKAKDLVEKNNFYKECVYHVYPALAEAYLGQYIHDEASQTRKKLQKIKEACRHALSQTRSWPTHYGPALRAMGRYYALAGHQKKARKYLVLSIQWNEKIGRRMEAAKGYYEYGLWLKNSSQTQEAQENFKKAQIIFKEINAGLYLQRLKELLAYEKESNVGLEEVYRAQERLRTERKLKSLIQVSQYLSAIVNLNELLEKIVESAIEVVGAERGFLMLHKGVIADFDVEKKDKGELVLMASRNIEKDSLKNEEFQICNSVIDKVRSNNEPLVVMDVASDTELKNNESAMRYGLKSILCVPLLTKNNQMLGLIYLDNRFLKNLFTNQDLELLKTLAVQAGISVENTILVEKEKEAVRKASESEMRAKYADMLTGKNEEIEKAYEKLKLTQGQLVQSAKMASVGQLAAGVAHEINNPTGFVLSNLEILKKYLANIQKMLMGYNLAEELLLKIPDPDAVRLAEDIFVLKKKNRWDYIMSDLPGMVEESKAGALRIKRIVEDLRIFSHVDEEKLQLSNINEIIEAALSIVWNELRFKVETVKEYGDVPPILCYPQELNQVFVNLLINAVQSIADKGVITVRTYLNDKSVFVEVIDTGSGMPPEIIARLFEPFFTTKPIGQGTGLGLSVAYGIIQRHKGEIFAKSQPGAGSTLTVRLPYEMAQGEFEKNES
ncbi:MAG: protein kinase [Candidatus Omnitrophica bacterium]|nr:protein kinase [Candidatus Omnitrophota bacterium]